MSEDSTHETLTRARSFQEYAERFQGSMISEKAGEIGRGFKPRPTDVIITPFSKSGTTWLQQIVHTLRTRGDMAFDDISRVVPWLSVSYDFGIDINAEQRAKPRAYKSHASWHDIPKGGRYIVSIRNPKDVLVSSYRFTEGWFFEPGAFPLETYAEERFLNPDQGNGYWNHLLSWWPQRDRGDVLLLSFEQMRKDLASTIRTVAAFIEIPLDDDLFELTMKHASFEFMQAHKDRFDDLMMRELSERVYDLPAGSDSSKVRKGTTDQHRYELSPKIDAAVEEKWRQEITPVLGFATYEAFRAELIGRESL